jgi:hypothetical protein
LSKNTPRDVGVVLHLLEFVYNGHQLGLNPFLKRAGFCSVGTI